MNIAIITLFIAFVTAAILYVINTNSKINSLRSKASGLAQELELHKVGLRSTIGFIQEKNSVFLEMKKSLIQNGSARSNSRVLKSIENSISEGANWESFLRDFERIDHQWIKSVETSVNFTKTDLKLLAMHKLELTNRDMASLMNISSDGIKKAQTRLRKKLKIESKQTLKSFLKNN